MDLNLWWNPARPCQIARGTVARIAISANATGTSLKALATEPPIMHFGDRLSVSGGQLPPDDILVQLDSQTGA